MQNLSNTQYFRVEKETPTSVKEILRIVYEALDEKGQFSFAPAHQMYQRAACVAMVAAAHLDRAIKPHAFVPEYLRLSQAERERAEKEHA